MSQVLCIGHAVQDLVFSVDEIPPQPDKFRASAFDTVGGGPAATAAVAICKLGGTAQLAARVGDDLMAGLIVTELESYGVDCALLKRLANRRSSVSAVIVDREGERLIVNYLDAGMDSEPAWLPERLPENVAAVLVDSRWPEGALSGLNLARQRNLPAILDADLPAPLDGKLVEAATHVAFSAGGLAEFSGIENPEEALKSVDKLTEAWCCVTLGSQGTLAIQDGCLTRQPAFDITVRDTLGAGDVWHGAFALALAEEQTISEAMRFASAAAALKVQNGGGRAGCASRQEVENLMNKQVMENRT